MLFAPCDAPGIDGQLAVHAAAGLSAGGRHRDGVGVEADGEPTLHPVFALMRASLVDDLESFLRSGERKVRAWYARHKTVEVAFTDQPAFYNINDLQQLDALERK